MGEAKKQHAVRRETSGAVCGLLVAVVCVISGTLQRSRTQATALFIAKENDRRADFNSEIPMETPGWQYDNYANFNPPVDAEPVMTKAGALNKKYGFSTWQGPTNSYSPPIQGGRYGTSNELDGTDMSAVFKTPSTPMLRMQPFAFARPQMKGALYYTGSSTPGRGYYADLVTNPRETPMAYLEREAAAKAAAQEEADAASSLEEADTESAARRPRAQLMGRYEPTSRVFSVFGR